MNFLCMHFNLSFLNLYFFFIQKFKLYFPIVKPTNKTGIKVASRNKKMPPAKNKSAPMRKLAPKMTAVRKAGDKKVVIRRNAKFIKRKGKGMFGACV